MATPSDAWPLSTLYDVRVAEEEDARRALADAVRARGDAERAAESAEEARRAAEVRREDARRDAGALAASGDARVGELAARDGLRVRHDAALAQATAARDAAAVVVKERAADEARAQAALGERVTARKALEGQRETWRRERERAAERRAEAEQDDRSRGK